MEASVPEIYPEAGAASPRFRDGPVLGMASLQGPFLSVNPPHAADLGGEACRGCPRVRPCPWSVDESEMT